jgi:hypothetical protein
MIGVLVLVSCITLRPASIVFMHVSILCQQVWQNSAEVQDTRRCLYLPVVAAAGACRLLGGGI